MWRLSSGSFVSIPLSVEASDSSSSSSSSSSSAPASVGNRRFVFTGRSGWNSPIPEGRRFSFDSFRVGSVVDFGRDYGGDAESKDGGDPFVRFIEWNVPPDDLVDSEPLDAVSCIMPRPIEVDLTTGHSTLTRSTATSRFPIRRYMYVIKLSSRSVTRRGDSRADVTELRCLGDALNLRQLLERCMGNDDDLMYVRCGSVDGAGFSAASINGGRGVYTDIAERVDKTHVAHDEATGLTYRQPCALPCSCNTVGPICGHVVRWPILQDGATDRAYVGMVVVTPATFPAAISEAVSAGSMCIVAALAGMDSAMFDFPNPSIHLVADRDKYTYHARLHPRNPNSEHYA